MPADPATKPVAKDIVVYKSAEEHPEKKNIVYLNDSHPMYDPLLYVLLFPFGDKGWENCSNMTRMKYYANCLMIKSGNTFNILHRGG